MENSYLLLDEEMRCVSPASYSFRSLISDAGSSIAKAGRKSLVARSSTGTSRSLKRCERRIGRRDVCREGRDLSVGETGDQRAGMVRCDSALLVKTFADVLAPQVNDHRSADCSIRCYALALSLAALRSSLRICFL